MLQITTPPPVTETRPATNTPRSPQSEGMLLAKSATAPDSTQLKLLRPARLRRSRKPSPKIGSFRDKIWKMILQDIVAHKIYPN